MDESLNGTPGYVQFEYISEQMRDLFAISSIVIARAGANLCLCLMGKGRRIGYDVCSSDLDMTKDTLLAAVRKLYADRHQYIINMEKSEQQDSIDKIMNLIKDNSK